ncbi:hypothetical protein QFC22_005927 [Naganishia vaughanmartiniae]|uniref:Uncharacterized protein n=1 Tax=Naganishia vaughanmartiniae TaxID=1424756 RepID=A0ACC2WPC3_9TREE|nr:hypothetical protein QFC22_005927 [Naganishia vaughanmartiniae]
MPSNNQQSHESNQILKVVRLVQTVKHKEDTSSPEASPSPAGVASASTSDSSLSSDTQSGEGEDDLSSLLQRFMNAEDEPDSILALRRLIDGVCLQLSTIIWPADAVRFLEQHSTEVRAAAAYAKVQAVVPYVLARSIVPSLDQSLNYPAGHSCWAVFVDTVSIATQYFAQSLANNSALPVAVYLTRACPIATVTASVKSTAGNDSHPKAHTGVPLKPTATRHPSSTGSSSSSDVRPDLPGQLNTLSLTATEATSVSPLLLPSKFYMSRMIYDMDLAGFAHTDCNLRSSLNVTFEKKDPSNIGIISEIAVRQEAGRYRVLDMWYEERLEHVAGDFRSDPSMQRDEIFAKRTSGQSAGKSLGATLNFGAKPSAAVSASRVSTVTSASEIEQTRPYTFKNEVEDVDGRIYWIAPTDSAPDNWIVPNIQIMSTFKDRLKKPVPAVFTTQVQIILQPQMEASNDSPMGYLLINQLRVENCLDFSGSPVNLIEADYLKHESWMLKLRERAEDSTGQGCQATAPHVVEGCATVMHGVGKFTGPPPQLLSKPKRKGGRDLKPEFYAGAKWNVAKSIANRAPLCEYSISAALLDREARSKR